MGKLIAKSKVHHIKVFEDALQRETNGQMFLHEVVLYHSRSNDYCFTLSRSGRAIETRRVNENVLSDQRMNEIRFEIKLASFELGLEDMATELSSSDTIKDRSKYKRLAKQYAEREQIVEIYRKSKKIDREIVESQDMLTDTSDNELKQLVQEELRVLKREKSEVDDELLLALLPKDPNDERNVIVEIRAGTGGNEATLFAQELFRMYSRFAETQKWKVEILESSASEIGGFKEVIVAIQGQKVFSRMKYESGVHRVQRVPQTETQGRVHTSAATVAVLPEAEEIDVSIDPKDIRIDTFCSSGPGGQSVNTTYSAIRITHLATGMIVSCQDEKSQIKNKAKAMRVLRARLYELEQQKQHDAIAAERRDMVKTGDRSEKIRTYNFPQSRVTDHRIGLTLHQLPEIMEGRLDPVIEPLITHFQAERLKAELDGG